jgi:hypothetical protein
VVTQFKVAEVAGVVTQFKVAETTGVGNTDPLGNTGVDHIKITGVMEEIGNELETDDAIVEEKMNRKYSARGHQRGLRPENEKDVTCMRLVTLLFWEGLSGYLMKQGFVPTVSVQMDDYVRHLLEEGPEDLEGTMATQTAIAFLTTWVKCPDTANYEKLG